MESNPLTYQVYIVRCWEESGQQDGPNDVRFMLESPTTGKRRGFICLETLLETLRVELTQMQGKPKQNIVDLE
ncbi:hypothetical protein KFU94_16345 [Chloroflexi bacterium TSY]|nr:hypothetical protein [Chloroflexi bacterium TSY]